jgi:hypothetical protein
MEVCGGENGILDRMRFKIRFPDKGLTIYADGQRELAIFLTRGVVVDCGRFRNPNLMQDGPFLGISDLTAQVIIRRVRGPGHAGVELTCSG